MITEESIEFTSDLRPENTNYLLGNLFYRLSAVISLKVETLAKATNTAPIELEPQVTWSTTGGWLKANGSRFADFHVGQTVVIIGASTPGNNGTFTIQEKWNDDYIRVNTSFSFENSTGVRVYLDRSEYDSMVFEFNMIGNNESINYQSKIDGEAQKFTLQSPGGSLTNMNPSGPNLSWFDGYGCKVSKNNTGFQGVRFVVQHTFLIGPWFLHQDYANLGTLTPPTWFQGADCLRYIYKATVAPNLNNPNDIQTIESNLQLGNTGWYNERFNGQPNYYSISGVDYERTSDGAPISGIELAAGDSTTMEFFIDNTTDSPFATFPSGTELVVNTIFLPSTGSQYKNLTTTAEENFRHNRVQLEVGGPSVNGNQNGDSDLQLIVSGQATFVSTSQIKVTLVLAPGTNFLNFLNGLATRRYLIAVYLQDETLAFEQSDGVTLLVDYSDFVINLAADGLVTHDHVMIRHPHTSRADGLSSNLTSHSEDEIISSNEFTIDTSVINATTVTLEGCTHIIRAENSVSGADFEMDRLDIDLSTKPIVNGMTAPGFSQVIPHKAPSGELITLATIERDFAQDTATSWVMTFNYPFLVRWEFWEQLLTANSAFYDNTLPNNGLSHDWKRYDDLANWEIKCVSRINMNVDGVVYSYESEIVFEIVGHQVNPVWDETLKTFDKSGSPQLFNSGQHYIRGYDDTLVQADFTRLSGSLQPLTNYCIVLRLEPTETGGRYVSTRISSARVKGTPSQFKSIDASDKVVITNPSGLVVRGEALIDYTKLTQGVNYDITARLYELLAVAPDDKLTTGGPVKTTTGGANKKIT